MMEPFAVRIGIDTPLSLRGLLHLDGLLGALAVGRGKEATDIPLQKYESIYQGSAALLETGSFGLLNGEQIRLKHVAEDKIPDGIFDHLKPAQRKIGPMSPMRNSVAPYPYYAGVRAVWFAGYGHSEAVVDLLKDARNLGAMGRTGYGRITELETFKIEQDDFPGLLFSSKLPARTIPLEMWDRFNSSRPEDAVISLQRFQPPYWTGSEVPCISPMQVDLNGTAGDIRKLLHLN
jgi:hypothetical protein